MPNELLEFVLAHDKFPSNRLPSLYSDFRYLRTTNPAGFAANVDAWKTVLRSAAARGLLGNDKLVVHTGEPLVAQLATRQWGRPLALGAVVGEAVANKDFYPLSTFLRQSGSVYSRGWAGAIVAWGLGKLGLSSPEAHAHTTNGEYVVIGNVEEAAAEIVTRISSLPSRASRIFTPSLFASELAPECSPTDLSVLLTYLARDRSVCACSPTAIKLFAEHEPPSPVTESDASIASLRGLIASLNLRVAELSASVSSYEERARDAIITKRKPLALEALRSKKFTEAALKEKAGMLGLAEEVYRQIEHIADQAEILRAMEGSAMVLRELNKEVGGSERASEVMDDLRKEMEDAREINQIIAEGETNIDEDEVEGELEAMLAQTQKGEKENGAKRLPALPDVPQRAVSEVEGQLRRLELDRSAAGTPGRAMRERETEDREGQEEQEKVLVVVP